MVLGTVHICSSTQKDGPLKTCKRVLVIRPLTPVFPLVEQDHVVTYRILSFVYSQGLGLSVSLKKSCIGTFLVMGQLAHVVKL